MIKKIAHVCFCASDLNATRRFFSDFLGFPTQFDFLRDGRKMGFYVNAGNGQFIEVFESKETSMLPTAAIRHMCFEVNACDDVVDRAKTYGYPVTEKKLGADHAWQCWVDGPDGLRFEFHEYTDKSCQKTGADCVVNW